VVVGAAVRAALKPDRTIDPSKLAAVEHGDIARSVVATGKIEPRAKVEVKSKASGIVKEIFVDYGEWVKQGEVLVELDKEELQARVREARATLLAAEAAGQAAQASYERNQVEAEGPDLPFLKSSMERAHKLHEDGLISRAVLEDAEKAYQLALNKQMMALRNVSVARAEIARAKAQVAQTRAALDRAEEDLRNSTIVSSMNGLVLSRDVEVGDAVSSILVLGSQATLVMTLGDVSDVYVLGKVDDPTGKLKANMTANAEIILQEKHDVLLVRESAVVYNRDREASVRIPDPSAETGRRMVPVELGISDGIKTELVAGLSEGQQVILQ